MAVRHRLQEYQVDAGRAILESVLRRRGLTFTVEIARQGGKNELSAQLELLLMVLSISSGGEMVKAAPTFSPQGLVSLRRLRERLEDAGLGGLWTLESGRSLRLGRARETFLSAEPSANVVGATADLLLEVDEAQDVSPEKFLREFRPMGATGNATTVLYGTPWDGRSLLEQAAQENLALERADGVRRHFRFDWEAVAACNPLYLRYVEAERARLGEEHPLFKTQYRLLPVAGDGGLFSAAQRAQLQGSHQRQRGPSAVAVCVAGVDVAGEPWGEPEGLPPAPPGPADGRRDATVVTIGEVERPAAGLLQEPSIRVVEHYWFRGEPHHSLAPRLADLLQGVWRCRRVVVDATGLGAGLASFLGKALGPALHPFVFTAASKSRLGFDLLAAVNTGRLKVYASDGSEEYREFWRQMELARGRYRANQTMEFFVEPAQGHDDYVMSLALLVRAAQYTPRAARARAPG